MSKALDIDFRICLWWFENAACQEHCSCFESEVDAAFLFGYGFDLVKTSMANNHTQNSI